MKNRKVANAKGILSKAAFFGAILFGALTVLVGLCAHLNEGTLFLWFMVTYITNLIYQYLGLANTSQTFISGLRGIPFAAVINAIIGSVVFSGPVALWCFVTRGHRKNASDRAGVRDE
jgi:hypothetical protein